MILLFFSHTYSNINTRTVTYIGGDVGLFFGIVFKCIFSPLNLPNLFLNFIFEKKIIQFQNYNLYQHVSNFLLDFQKLEREARICRKLQHPNIGEQFYFLFK